MNDDAIKQRIAEMRPTDQLGVIAYRAARHDAWCNFAPEWAKVQYIEEAKAIGETLRRFGITDEMVKLKEL